MLITNSISSPWILKGVSATLQSGRYNLSYPRGRFVLVVLNLFQHVVYYVIMYACIENEDPLQIISVKYIILPPTNENVKLWDRPPYNHRYSVAI